MELLVCFARRYSTKSLGVAYGGSPARGRTGRAPAVRIGPIQRTTAQIGPNRDLSLLVLQARNFAQARCLLGAAKIGVLRSDIDLETKRSHRDLGRRAKVDVGHDLGLQKSYGSGFVSGSSGVEAVVAGGALEAVGIGKGLRESKSAAPKR